MTKKPRANTKQTPSPLEGEGGGEGSRVARSKAQRTRRGKRSKLLRRIRRRMLRGALFLGLPFAVAYLGSRWNSGNLSWYRKLDKPNWTPPSEVFAPVWTALYLAMGVAAWQVRAAGRKQSRVPLAIWCGQLGLNLAWSYAFFQRRDPRAALAVIAALWLAIAATIATFAPRSRFAALLLTPYLAWVSYAAALNGEIARTN